MHRRSGSDCRGRSPASRIRIWRGPGRPDPDKIWLRSTASLDSPQTPGLRKGRAISVGPRAPGRSWRSRGRDGPVPGRS